MPIKPENVDQYLESGCGRCEYGGTSRCKVHRWAEPLRMLRTILRESGLIEEVKWSVPCYTHGGKNIVILSALKESVVVSFFRGAEMRDPEKILEKPGDNSRFVRYIRFRDTETISSLKPAVLSYIQDAIEIEKYERDVGDKKHSRMDHPMELMRKFEEAPDFEAAFLMLTPGRQRGYLIYFSAAKQSATRSRRIEKCMPKIFAGKGWNER